MSAARSIADPTTDVPSALEVAARAARERLATLKKERAIREEVRAAQRLERELLREELAARFEGELGAEGSEFEIVDTGHLGDPLLVVKRPALVQWTKYEQSKQTAQDRYEMVVPSLVHPTIDEFNALRDKRIGGEIQAANALARLMGLTEASDRGK